MSDIIQLDMTVVIPFKDKAAMTLDCINSLFLYGPTIKEIFLVSNNSTDDELAIIRDGIKDKKNIRLLEYNHPFNYQKINNWTVKRSTGKTILFLNNDTELRPASKGLLERMYQKSQEDHVGMVGCLLLFGGEKTIQHAGVYLMPGGQADHLYVAKKLSTAIQQAGTKEFPYDVRESRKLTAVTGAVQMVQRKKFDAVAGFDERFIIWGEM